MNIVSILLLGLLFSACYAEAATAPASDPRITKTPEEVIALCNACGGPDKYAPVCGADGQTYGNECIAKCANVPIKDKGACNTAGCYPYGEGKCSGNFDSTDAVCSNGLTFIDLAEANCDGTALSPGCYSTGVCQYHPDVPSGKFLTTGGKGLKVEDAVKKTQLPGTTDPAYDYSEALTKALLFYDSMISGKIVAAGHKRLTWRDDSCSECIGKYKEDLSGGFYEAGGSSQKFPGVINGYAGFMLAWGGLEFAEGYTKTDTMTDLKWKVKWAADHIINAHVSNSPFQFAGYLGNSTDDFDYFGPIEFYEKYNKPRPIGYVNAANPASEIVADGAAALAAASLLLKADDTAWAAKALEHAKQLYAFGKANQGSYNDAKDPVLLAHADMYESDGFNDELAWAAAWLHKATGEAAYLTDAKSFQAKVKTAEEYTPTLEAATLWPATLVLLAQSDPSFISAANSFFDKYMNGQVPHTPAGLAMPYHWGNLRQGANVAFLAMIHRKNPKVDASYRTKIVNYAFHQVNYILGDAGRSWMVGFGKDYPTHVWHKHSYNSYITWNEELEKSIYMTNDDGPWAPEKKGKNMYAMIAKFDMEGDWSPNKHIAYGTLFGGALDDDSMVAARKDYTYTEPTIEYNAGITGALAALSEWYQMGPYAGVNSLEDVLPFNGNVSLVPAPAPFPVPVPGPVLAPAPGPKAPVPGPNAVIVPPITTVPPADGGGNGSGDGGAGGGATSAGVVVSQCAVSVVSVVAAAVMLF